MSTPDSFFDRRPLFVLDHKSLDILDVNESAVERYGFSREELLSMNVNDLGVKSKRTELIQGIEPDNSVDKIWRHTTKSGEDFFVQFTHHVFNYQGQPAKLAVAHEVTELVSREETDRHEFPQVDTHRENVPLAEIEWNAQKQVIRWSERAEELFGYREEEVIGKEGFFEEFVHEEELENAYQVIEEALQNRKAGYTVEGRVRTKSGKILICEWYNSLVYNESGELVSVNSLVHDISDRKESEYLFRALSEESLVGVYLIQDGVFKYVNPKLASIFHYQKESIENKLGPMDLTHPDDRDTVRRNIQRRITGESKGIEYDFRGVTRDNQTIHVNVYGTAITYFGKPAIIGTLLDITDTKLALARYRASVESFEDLFDSISDAIYIQNRDGKFIEVNQAAVELNGYDRERLIGSTPDFLAAPGKTDLDETHEYFKKALNGEVQQFEQWGLRKNGEVFPEEVVLSPGTYFGEDVVIAISRDISAQYETQERMRKNEELFRQLFQNSPVAIVMMDEHQEIRHVNEAFTDLFGYTPSEAEGIDIDQLIVPREEFENARALSRTIFQGRTSNMTARRVAKDGSVVDVLIYGVPVTVNGNTIAIYGMYIDITDQKRAEEQIKQSLREKEVLLAEIHHRVKNNLAVITGLLELQAYNTSSVGARNVLQESQMRINSIALIHEKLYQNEDLSSISFDVYLKELTEVIVSSMETGDKKIELHIDAPPIHLTINQAIPCGLILNELITNAYKHAFPDTGEGNIYVELRQAEESLLLLVRDDGVGLPDDFDLEEPKSLGMTLISTLSRQLNGTHTFNRGSEGTEFELQFEAE